MRPDDDRTIRGFLAGDPASVSLVERWITAASRAFESRLASHREDLRQDVLAELTRLLRQDKFRGESSLVSYVWQITNHACIRQTRLLSRWAAPSAERQEEPRDEQLSAVDGLLQRDRMERIRRIAAQLPEECRQLWSRVLSGASYQQMSAELGLAEGTLRVRLLRCRRKAQAIRETFERSRM
ncbi:MAG: sigma-70 family RNA polymerase sigma factor [Acidobacteria bacterium]|nr:sigma-70 family RNA polymerase sigma factor [Acidobacteriota bacterium]